MDRSLKTVATLAIAILAGACGSDVSTNPFPVPPIQPTVISSTGSITADVAAFRTLLGDPSNGGTAGEQPAGRREISWDGAGANPFDNRNDFPAAFFNTNVKSGAVFTTPGTGFRNDSTKFAEVDAAYANEFSAFSPTKIFSPIGSNLMDVDFQIAGQPTPALVSGFGAVFSDVDVANTTSIEFFDKDGASLAKIVAPVRTDVAGFSFVGARFPTTIVARVRITLGTGALAANAKDISAGGAFDLVVADNFIYGEPKQIQ
jgi:hypothetical protein